MSEKHFIGLIAIISAVNVLLILLGKLPPMSSANAVSMALNLLSIAALLGLGYAISSKGMKHAAMTGAFAMFVSVIIVYIGIFIGRFTGKSVLGLPTPSDSVLLFNLLLLLVANALIGAVVVAVSAAVTGLLQPKALQKNTKKR
jgi:hypothetical protein